MYMHRPPVSHLHLHHLVFALRAEGPLVGQGIVVVGALVAVQRHGVAWQLDHLDEGRGKTRLSAVASRV